MNIGRFMVAPFYHCLLERIPPAKAIHFIECIKRQVSYSEPKGAFSGVTGGMQGTGHKRSADTLQVPEGASKVQRLLQQALAGGPSSSNGAAAGSQATQAQLQEDEDDEGLLAALPSDLMAAVLFLRSQAQIFHASHGLPPVFLRTQLNSILKETTGIERELDQLRRDQVVRVFKLSTGHDEYALMLSEDYTSVLRQAAVNQSSETAPSPSSGDRAGSEPGPSATARRRVADAGGGGGGGGGGGAPPGPSALQAAVEVFCTRVLPHHSDLSISRPQLLNLLSQRPRPRPRSSTLGGRPDTPSALRRPGDGHAGYLTESGVGQGSSTPVRGQTQGQRQGHSEGQGQGQGQGGRPLLGRSDDSPANRPGATPSTPSSRAATPPLRSPGAPLAHHPGPGAPNPYAPSFGAPNHGARNPSPGAPNPNALSPDAQVSLLMQLGALSRDPRDEELYWMGVPGLGKVVVAMAAGRQELTTLLGRRKYREVPEKQLLTKTKLRRSPLGVGFHLRDMLGLGLLHRVTTTSGAIIRLVGGQR